MRRHHKILYKPSLPHKNDNISHNQPLKEFLTLLGGVIVLFLLLFWSFGLFIDLAVSTISPEKEAILFSKLRLNWTTKNTRSPTQMYLQGLTDNLRTCFEIRYPIEVILVESREANAFAAPGGAIIVFSGLLGKVQSENGLAFVLAHELSHFDNRDHLRGLGRSVVLLSLTSLLTGANSDITQAITPVELFSQAHYSQARENAADKKALTTLNCAYSHVGGATELFTHLLKDYNEQKTRAAHYFSSHPNLQQRIDNLKQQAFTLGYRTDKVNPLKRYLKQNSSRRR